MKVTLTEMHSIQDAIRTMYMSKRTWTPKLEQEIQDVVYHNTDRTGKPFITVYDATYGGYQSSSESKKKFKKMTETLFKWGQKHTTMLRFLDLSVIVEGLHRGATDDFDSHAKRLENRIIRSSTRLADYSPDEMSDWYKGKIIPTDLALGYIGIKAPETLEHDGKTYVRTGGGYVLEGLENNRDVKRGLYTLALPMTFTFKVNLVELAHIYRERGMKEHGANGTAAPELQEMMESLMDQLESWYPMLTREYLLGICN